MYLTLSQLNPSQRAELCQNYLCFHDNTEHFVSWEELAEADSLVSDEDLKREYGSTSFVPEDFSCATEIFD